MGHYFLDIQYDPDSNSTFLQQSYHTGSSSSSSAAHILLDVILHNVVDPHLEIANPDPTPIKDPDLNAV